MVSLFPDASPTKYSLEFIIALKNHSSPQEQGQGLRREWHISSDQTGQAKQPSFCSASLCLGPLLRDFSVVSPVQGQLPYGCVRKGCNL